jgi:hypothetical protein
MRRIPFRIICLFALAASDGCVFPYCAFPTLDYTPQVKLNTPIGEVRAFRVDISNPTADMSVFQGRGYERLSELPVSNTDEVPAQLKPSFTYGLVVIGVALNYLTYTSHSMALRLYRPGFEVTEVRSWARVSRVVWKPAADLDAQERALDSLLPIGRIEKGSQSAAHRDALLFGAAEYSRLAAAAQLPDQQTRLGEKAKKLQVRASE